MNAKPLLVVAAAAALALLPSCSTTGVGSASLAAYQAYDVPTKLPTNPRNVRVKVSLSKQRVYVMEGSTMLMAMPVSVGAPGSSTPAGNFSIFNKEHKHRANTHGYAYSGDSIMQTFLAKKRPGWIFKGTPMPYWCEFKPNYGFHTGWVKHQPCTHGCIRMHENLAPKFFRLVSVGTPVNIASSQPEDATVSVPMPPDAGPLPDYTGRMYITDGYFTQHKTPVYQ
ncbi:MAG: L,D-transpeptidase [Verrucomicrobia bacterium]|nr:L,D-transpeptidase [Verrucomicrobiota bacterium]